MLYGFFYINFDLIVVKNRLTIYSNTDSSFFLYNVEHLVENSSEANAT